MNFYQFNKGLKQSVCGSQVQKESVSYGRNIILTVEGKVFVDFKETEFKSLEEAKEYTKRDYISHRLEEEVSKDSYEDLSEVTIANIIKEHHNVKVTDTLIENYLQLASSNMFSVDPVVQKIRSLNKLDRLIEGKLNYSLNDGSVVAINEATQERLNNLLQNHVEIIEYMRESKDNFFHVIRKLEE